MKKLLISFFAAMCAMHAFSADYDFKYNDLYYKITDENNKYVKLVPPPTGIYSLDSLIIPGNVKYNSKSYTIRTIGRDAFRGNGYLKYIRMNRFGIDIEQYAFYKCTSLKSANLNSVDNIDEYAFAECTSLEHVQMMNVRKLYKYAFSNCKNLNTVLLGPSFETLSYNAFINCDKLTRVFCLASQPFTCEDGNTTPTCTTTFIVPLEYLSAYYLSTDSWITKGNISQEFVQKTDFGGQSCETTYCLKQGTSLVGYYDTGMNVQIVKTNSSYSSSDLVIPDNVDMFNDRTFFIVPVSIARLAFCAGIKTWAHDVQNITIGYSVNEIADGAFIASYVKKFTLRNDLYFKLDANGALFDRDMTRLICYPGAMSKKSYVVPTSVKEIRTEAFEGCLNLENVYLPKGLKKIYNRAFSGCWYLRSVDIPEGVTDIYNNAFQTIKKLATIKFPSTINQIGSGAFTIYDGDDVEDVYCYATTVPSLTFSDAFDSKVLKATLHVPEGCESKYQSSSPWNKFARIVGDLDANYAIPEDVNMDGEVNSLDVLKVYKYMQQH